MATIKPEILTHDWQIFRQRAIPVLKICAVQMEADVFQSKTSFPSGYALCCIIETIRASSCEIHPCLPKPGTVLEHHLGT